MKSTYINYPGLGLGFTAGRYNKDTKVGIVSTGEYKIIPTNKVKSLLIPQSIKINQIGYLNLYEHMKVRTPKESYILQLLRISDKGCTFAKFWQDNKLRICRNGVLVLDNNNFFKVKKDVMKLRKLSRLPKWMVNNKNSPRLLFNAKY